MLRTVKTSGHSVRNFVKAPAHGERVVLLHGWVAVDPYTAGYRTYAPNLRGCGPTRVVTASTQRSGQLSKRFFSARLERKPPAHLGHFPQRALPEQVVGEITGWLQEP